MHTSSRNRVIVWRCISVAIGTLWEIAEWSYDRVVAGNVIKGKTDTMIDLIVDAIGAVMAGVLSIGMVQE